MFGDNLSYTRWLFFLSEGILKVYSICLKLRSEPGSGKDRQADTYLN